MKFCTLCNTEIRDRCCSFHFCAYYPGEMIPSGFSVCSYFVLAIILIPLTPILMILTPPVYLLINTFYRPEDWAGSEDFTCSDFVRMCTLYPCIYSKEGCFGLKPCIAWPLILIFIIIIWIPIVLTLALLVSALFLICGTPCVCFCLMIYIFNVIKTVVTLWIKNDFQNYLPIWIQCTYTCLPYFEITEFN